MFTHLFWHSCVNPIKLSCQASQVKIRKVSSCLTSAQGNTSPSLIQYSYFNLVEQYIGSQYYKITGAARNFLNTEDWQKIRHF